MFQVIVPREHTGSDESIVERMEIESWLDKHCPGYLSRTLRPCYTIEIRRGWIAEFVIETCAQRFDRKFGRAKNTAPQRVHQGPAVSLLAAAG